VGKRWCDVTVETPKGKRHTITVESTSVYEAAMEFFGRSGATFPGDSLPPTNKDTVFEVRPIYRVTQKQLMDWAKQEGGALRSIAEVSQVALAEVNSLSYHLFRCQPVRFRRAIWASLMLP